MKETPQQYKKRLFRNVAGKRPLAVQRATPGRLERLLRGFPRAALRRRPAPGKWSAAEIFAHLADTEWVAGYRMRTMLSASGTKIAAFDQNDWARNHNYARQDPRRSVALFRALREANLEFVRRLSPAKLRRYGIHAERGRESIADMVRMMAGHDVNHLRQLEDLRRRFRRR